MAIDKNEQTNLIQQTSDALAWGQKLALLLAANAAQGQILGAALQFSQAADALYKAVGKEISD